MKKLLAGVLVIGILILTNSCRKALKDVNDYFPKIKTVSAIIQPDGSVTVTGEIESTGGAKNSSIEYTGFCVSTNNDPKMLDNQIIAKISGSTFTANYPVTKFNVDSTYYFKCWATNNYGYAYGDAIKINHIIATPVTPPCTLAENVVNIGGSTPNYNYYSIGAPDEYNYFSAATSSGPTVNFQFGSALTTGVFHTTLNTSPNFGEVFVVLYDGFISGALNDGSNVYVNKLSATSFEVTICSAPWTGSGSTLNFSTHFVTPY